MGTQDQGALTPQAPEPVAPTHSEQGEPAKTIPYSRFSEVLKERDSHASEVSALKARLAEVESKYLDTSKRYESERGEWGNTLALIENGFGDEEGRKVAQFHWSQLPATDRPPIGEWVAGLRQNPEAAPKSLSHWINPPAQEQKAPVFRPGIAQSVGSVSATQRPPSDVFEARVRELAARAQRGDRAAVEEYRQLSQTFKK